MHGLDSADNRRVARQHIVAGPNGVKSMHLTVQSADILVLKIGMNPPGYANCASSR